MAVVVFSSALNVLDRVSETGPGKLSFDLLGYGATLRQRHVIGAPFRCPSKGIPDQVTSLFCGGLKGVLVGPSSPLL